MEINSIADVAQLKPFAVIPLVMGALISWIKFRQGNLLFSRSRTERLYALMEDDAKWRRATSGALQQAVKDALGVELSGDVIRYSLQRDNPLSALRAFKQSKGLVRLAEGGNAVVDARKKPRWSFEGEFFTFLGLTVSLYFLFMLVGANAKLFSPVFLAVLLTIEGLAVPIFMWTAFRAEAAHRLLSKTAFPLPSSFALQAMDAQPASELLERSSETVTA